MSNVPAMPRELLAEKTIANLARHHARVPRPPHIESCAKRGDRIGRASTPNFSSNSAGTTRARADRAVAFRRSETSRFDGTQGNCYLQDQ